VINGKVVPLCDGGSGEVGRIYTENKVRIEPRLEVVAKTSIRGPRPRHLVNYQYIVESSEFQPGVVIGNTLVGKASREVYVRLLNSSEEVVEVKSGQYLASAEPVIDF